MTTQVPAEERLPNSAPEPEQEAGPTERGWWEASKEQWSSPGEWTIWNFVILAFLVLLFLGMGYWATRPGQMLGRAEPLKSLDVYTSNVQGRYVYQLTESPGGNAERVRATLQMVYDRHKGAAQSDTVTVLILRQASDETPYIVGTGDTAGADVMGRAVVGPGQRQASVRRREDAPLEPIELRW